jgi:hypothetical protein
VQFYSIDNIIMLVKALGALGRAMLLLLMLSGWSLVILSVSGYAGSDWGFSSKHQQVWAVLVGLTLCGYQTFYWFKAPMGLHRRNHLPLQLLERFLLNVGFVIKTSLSVYVSGGRCVVLPRWPTVGGRCYGGLVGGG